MKKKLYFLLEILIITLCVGGCGKDEGKRVFTSDPLFEKESNENSVPRDNTPVVLIPTADESTVLSSSVACVDISHASEGYVTAKYTGEAAKVKFRIITPGQTTYTYNLTPGSDYETFPLLDSGDYTFAVFENVQGNEYYQVLSETVTIEITNEFGPFLYPNQYVWFTAESACVEKAKDLTVNSTSELETVAIIFEFVVNHITYDYDLADSVTSGYLPDPDTALETGSGICLDYSSLMAAMLRSQSIPTRLEVGYAGTAYHAWISTYITDMGWVCGIIHFDGTNWSIMDPTFAANNSAEAVKEYIGDGDNYSVKYIY